MSKNLVSPLQHNTYQKLWPHFVMYASSIISKQMGLKNQQKSLSTFSSGSTVAELPSPFFCTLYHPQAEKLTKQNRCFYLRKNLRGRCIMVLDGGTSFCCLRTQRVCSGEQSRSGATARRPNLAPTSPRWLLLRSGRAQRFQNYYHYL